MQTSICNKTNSKVLFLFFIDYFTYFIFFCNISLIINIDIESDFYVRTTFPLTRYNMNTHIIYTLVYP